METKAYIVEQAFKMFMSNGYRATTMSHLMEGTGLSKGAFYHHFASKEELYHAVVDTYFLVYKKSEDLDGMKEQSLTEVNQSIKEFVKFLVSEISKVTDKGMTSYFAMFFEAFSEYTHFKVEVKKFYSKFKQLLKEKFISEKGLSDNDADIEAVRYLAYIEGLFFWMAVFPEEDISKYFNFQ